MPMLTPELKRAVEQAGEDLVRLTDPETQRAYVLMPLDEYEKLAAGDDNSPWTDEEMEALSEEARQSLDGQTMTIARGDIAASRTPRADGQARLRDATSAP